MFLNEGKHDPINNSRSLHMACGSVQPRSMKWIGFGKVMRQDFSLWTDSLKLATLSVMRNTAGQTGTSGISTNKTGKCSQNVFINLRTK